MQHILSHRLFSTRSGTVLVGGLAALLAGVFVLVYLNNYRQSLKTSSAPVTVLVAKKLIQKGTPGNYVGSADLFVPTSIRADHVRPGAISDPAQFRDRVAINDVFPGQQLTITDFSITAVTALNAKLAKDQRAVAVPVDSTHGLTGAIQAGDHVDVFVGFNQARGSANRAVLKLLMPNALVLATAGQKSGIGSGVSGSNVVLRANFQQAAQLAFAADNGRIWLVLRPSANVTATPPEMVTVESILFGVKPVTVQRQIGRYLGSAQ